MSVCAICVNRPGTHLEPLGRNDAMVRICDECASEHPRAGRYAFAGSGDGDGRASAVAPANGNRQHTRRR